MFALVYSVLTAVVTGDFLGVGAQFLIWLIVAKAFNRRAARDWQQMYLLAFLMLVAGSVLNADLTYGLCFLGFVIVVDLGADAVPPAPRDGGQPARQARRRSRVASASRSGASSTRGASSAAGSSSAPALLSFGVFLGAAIVFLALPRVGFGFFLKSRGGLTLAGFSDGVKLGGHGVIKNDPTVVMRVEIDREYGGRDAPEIHWRGVAFD